MALARAFSFPLSHSEEVDRQPPFDIEGEDAAQLTSCDAFRAIRDLLGCQDNNAFCSNHHPSNNAQKEAWLLQRDITFALVFPILEIYRHATELALTMLGDRNIFDLELVFRGEARGAFSWLQCFSAVEGDWCHGEGCPACIVSYVLQSEPTIRIILVACRLASSLRGSNEEANHVPMFDFWIACLHKALRQDSFWGPTCMKDLEPKASALEAGIYAMAQQCCELEKMPSPNSSASESSPPASPTTSREPKRLGTYKKVKGKLTFVSDSSSWMQKIALGCWTTLLADVRQQGPSSAQKKAAGPSRPPSVFRSPSL